MTYLLGIDAGGTALKAVLYDETGKARATGSARCPTTTPRPGWVERDMDALWLAFGEAVRACLHESTVDPGAVAAVGIVGHNDGLYPVDSAHRPVRQAILSADARATSYVRRWRDDGTAASLREVIGQEPFPGSPAALAAWLRDHEPDAFAATRWALFCKDWLRLRLTGHLGTDPTEASASFLDVHTRRYSDTAVTAFGLSDFAPALPPISDSTAVVGTVSAAGAADTGLVAGTPVVCGAHDVDAAAIGVGAIGVGDVSVVAGTFSINQVVTDAVRCDPRWQCRQWVEPGRWLAMATSPASASNLEWFTVHFGPSGADGFAAVNAEVAAVLDGPPSLLYLPFLYGAPHGLDAGGAFVGLRGWHTRGHLLRAVLEGVALGHRRHLAALRGAFPTSGAVRLTGGGARSDIWCQLFADAFRLPVTTVDTPEAGARGAAVLAGLGVGQWTDLATAAAATARTTRTYDPRPREADQFDALYDRFERLLAADDLLAPLTPET